MKNIKKLLALALVLVLAIGMVPMAGAVSDIGDFPDADLIENQNEAGLITALGVMVGRANGSFDPTAGLTRAEAAVVLTRLMLGPDLAAIYERARVDTNFRDVTKSHWASGVIAYCYEQGWITGYSSTRYGHADPLTIPQFAIMLMRALGLATAADFQGATGSGNAIVAATGHGILTGSGIDFTGPASRDFAAKTAFNALISGIDAVQDGYKYIIVAAAASDTSITGIHGLNGREFSSFLEALSVGNAVGATFTSLTASKTSLDPDEFYIREEENWILSGGLLEDVFGIKPVQSTDDFGRPATDYVRAGVGKPIFRSVSVPVKTYVAATSGSAIFTDLRAIGASAANIGAATPVFKTDGTAGTAYTIALTATTSLGDSGAGVMTELYYDFITGAITVICVNTYVAKVSSVAAATLAAGKTITLAALDGKSKTTMTFETDDFARDDIVLYSYDAANDEIIDVWEPEKLTGTISIVTGTILATANSTLPTSAVSFVSDGTRYFFNVNNGSSAPAAPISVHATNEYDFFRDENGYVSYIMPKPGTQAAPNYAYVVATQTGAPPFTSNQAQLLFPDGTTKVVQTAPPAPAQVPATDGDIVSYTITNTTGVDVYSLTVRTTDKGKASTSSFTTGTTTLTFSTPTSSIPLASTLGSLVIDARTIVVTGQYIPAWVTTLYTGYTGFAGTPTLTLGISQGAYVDVNYSYYNDPATGRAVFVFIESSGFDTSGATKEVVYVVRTDPLPSVDAVGVPYYNSTVLINGESKNVVNTVPFHLGDLYENPQKNTAGQYTTRGSTDIKAGTSGYGLTNDAFSTDSVPARSWGAIARFSGGALAFDTGTISSIALIPVTENSKVYTINATGVPTEVAEYATLNGRSYVPKVVLATDGSVAYAYLREVGNTGATLTSLTFASVSALSTPVSIVPFSPNTRSYTLSAYGWTSATDDFEMTLGTMTSFANGSLGTSPNTYSASASYSLVEGVLEHIPFVDATTPVVDEPVIVPGRSVYNFVIYLYSDTPQDLAPATYTFTFTVT